jgi:phosphoglycerate dehydrogenase-like enzyme
MTLRLAILDDYAHVALEMADWSAIAKRCRIDVIDRALAVPDEAAEVLAPYHVLCHLRERTAMPRALIERLPRLQFMTITGKAHRTLDLVAARERGIVVSHSASRVGSGQGQGTPELTLGLMLALARKIACEDQRMRAGHWQSTVGTTLFGKTLGIVGLGAVGRRVAELGRAFGMEVLAWSPNLAAETAAAAGARLVPKIELMAASDYVSLHLVLGDRSRGIIGVAEIAAMKPTAFIVNTARGPLVNEAALMSALRERRIAGAGLDVYWAEPLAADHPVRGLDNVVITPHLGYVVEESLRGFYEDSVDNVAAWLDGRPMRVVGAN